MAELLGITEQALVRWSRRHDGNCRDPVRCGRPAVIPPAARQRIRECYVVHYGEWGPRVLAAWCRREGLGQWSASTIAAVIADLRPRRSQKRQTIGYEVKRSDVMWSEDGTGFRERGRKKELLVIQDEHARLKLGHRLVDGPANEDAVYDYLTVAFATHGAPLVLKHDGGSIFHGERIQRLLTDHQVTDLTSPPGYPPYNGKQERSMRDIKSYERAMRRHGVGGSLTDRLDAAIDDLNDQRPRPVLRGRTAREVHEADQIALPDRSEFIGHVNRMEKRLSDAARSRNERESARRRAVEQVLLGYGLMEEWSDVSRN
jgi:transposase InsO family protein